MEALEIGVREFREKLSDYILHSGKPVAVTRHGATVGYFIPAQLEHGTKRLQILKAAGAAVDAMLAEGQADESEIEEVVKEFSKKRRGRGNHGGGAPTDKV